MPIVQQTTEMVSNVTDPPVSWDAVTDPLIGWEASGALT